MMLAVSPSFVARSSLEEMLESLQRREEAENAEDKPPALPPRPKSNPRSRPPSAKRRLPETLRVSGTEMPLNCEVKREGNQRVAEMESTSLLSGPEVIKGTSFGEDIDREVVDASVPPSGSRRRSCDSGRDLVPGNFYNKRLRVWYRSPDDIWLQGQIKSTSGEKASVLLSDERVIAVHMQDLKPANPDILDAVDDLGKLSYLNEPSVLHTLQCRYSQDMIYTKAGDVLIALNPLKDVGIYGKECVTAYGNRLLCRPHVYGVVNEAYDKMMAGGGNQSIIISGESDSGKTETAKRALEYLAKIASSDERFDSKVLHISCILEAFGNAKSSRNDNSSRFGTLFEVHFSNVGKISSVQIMTFLVEKSRVVHLAQGERSYHIFYQLCCGAPADLRGRLYLKSASEYNYLNQSNCVEIPSNDDSQKFHSLLGALNAVGICQEDQDRVFELLAAVLWLGNISFLVTDDQTHVEVVHSEALNHSAILMGCSQDYLIVALSTRKIKAGKDVISRRLTLQQAIERRDALATIIYTSLFDWLVEKINLYIAMDRGDAWRSISILENCGFETSENNGFEQFCINYADERLQQHFNRHMFKLQQEECELEGIYWTKLDFRDNHECLDLFETKPAGLISVLDEVSSSPKATNLTLVTKLAQQLSANHCVKVQNDGKLTIFHSAGEVLYDTSEFLLKNRGPLYPEVIHLLSCSSKLTKFCSLTQSHGVGTTSLQSEIQCSQTQSFIMKLQDQLLRLFQHLDATKPHFIYCVRSNSKQIPGLFEQNLALQQLQRCNILDAVKISKYGYSTRISIEEFSQRYAVLVPENASQQDSLNKSIAILQHSGILPEMYQVGYTKLFFRAGQIKILDDARKKALQGTPEVQNCHRCHHGHLDMLELNGVATTLQSYVRGEIARKEFRHLSHLRRHDAAAAEIHDQQLMAVVHIQSVIRGWLVRKRRTRPPSRIQFKDLLRQPLSEEELQSRVSIIEVELREKEEENANLRNQIKQLEARWPHYEAKVKSLEEKWQKKISLQMKLATAKNNVDAGDSTAQPRKINGVQSPRSSYSDDSCRGSTTPGCSTPARCLESSADDIPSRENNSAVNQITVLVKEFEQRRQLFDVEARAIVDVKSSGRQFLNPVEEVELLKCRFKSWKREFGIRLREAKSKASLPEGEKHRWKWWGIKRTRS